MNLPRGAFPIAQARDHGKRPADPVVVSLCGWRQEFAYPQVLVTSSDHDWDFMLGLDAIVCVTPESAHVRPTLSGLRVADRIDLWDVKQRLGMTAWPVWKGLDGREVHWASPSDRRDAILLRWAMVHWLPAENKAFACA